MSQFQEIKTAIDLQHSAFDAFTKRQDTRFDEITDRVEAIEAGATSPGKVAETRETVEHKTRFEAWLRKPFDAARKNSLSDFEIAAKNVTIGTGAAGGFAVPAEIDRQIERLELKLSPVRRLVRVVKVGTPVFTTLLSLRGATSGWSGETDARTATATPTLREITPTFGELYAYPQASEWSLDDMLFDVGDWLAQEVAQEFALQEGAAVLTGNGANRPTGMLATTPTAADDFASPLRAAAAYQFVASLGNDSPVVAEIRADSLIDLMFTLNSSYRSGAVWIMNSKTAGEIRKLKDTQGRFLWADGLAAGQPSILLGHPVALWEQMADVSTNSFPIGFGDFSRAYILADRVGLRILEDRVTALGQVRFYVRRREGGMVLNNDSAKFLRTTIA